jgi:hypothetical protein
MAEPGKVKLIPFTIQALFRVSMRNRQVVIRNDFSGTKKKKEWRMRLFAWLYGALGY